jgi:hypothetical protein
MAKGVLLETISPPSHSTVHFISAIIDDNTGDVLKYHHLLKIDKHKQVWAHDFANEIGQLFQGIRNVLGTNTCFFIPKSHIPAHKCPTCGRICCNYQPQKEEKYPVRLTIGGNCINYPGNKSTSTVNPSMAKILISSTISTPGAKFLGIDLANFYLKPPCRTPNTCVSVSTSSPTKSSSITTFAILSLLMAGCTLKFKRGCMVFPKPASLQIKYLKSALPPKGTTNANIHLVSGAMSGGTSRSA